MAFVSKTDYFSKCLTMTGLSIVSNDENRACQTATAINEKGDVVAEEKYGETATPTCNYAVTDNATLTGIQMGKMYDYGTGGEHVAINGMTVTTAAGQPATVEITGQVFGKSVTQHTDCYYEVADAVAISICHHAQDVLGIGFSSMLGSTCFLTGCTFGMECDFTTATVDGEVVTYDITGGKETLQLTIQGTTSAKPEITGEEAVLSDWTVTAPLTCTNPEAGYPTYTISFEKGLKHATKTDDTDSKA